MALTPASSPPPSPPAPAPPGAPPSLEDAAYPRGLAALRHLLVEDEEGSAAVEFIVLVPVYILLLTGLFSLTQMVLIRQAVVGAARFEAWSGREVGDEALVAPFFPGASGRFTQPWQEQPGPKLDAEALQPKTAEERQGLIGGSEEHGRAIAAAVLNNEAGDGAPIRGSSASATFAYEGLLVGTRAVSLKTSAFVYLPTGARRPEHRDGQQDHFVARLPHAPFDPAEDENRYWSPVFGHFRGGFGGAGGDPGLWSNAARIDGSPFAEHSLFKREAPGQPKEVN